MTASAAGATLLWAAARPNCGRRLPSLTDTPAKAQAGCRKSSGMAGSGCAHPRRIELAAWCRSQHDSVLDWSDGWTAVGQAPVRKGLAVGEAVILLPPPLYL